MAQKRWMVILAAALVAALLFGCAAQMPNSNKGAAPGVQEQSGADTSQALSADPGKAALSGKRVIYNAEVIIQADSAKQAFDSITAKTAEMGGYLNDSYVVTDSRDNAESYVTVRIPPDRLKEFIAFVDGLGKSISSRVSSQDVTGQYYDVESRLNNAKAQEAQYLEMLKQLYKVEDILAVREKLDAVQLEIEQYRGQLNQIDNQADYATVKILIRQPPAPAVVVDENPDKGVQFWGFAAVWQKISRGFADGFNWTLNAVSSILMVLAYAILPIILVGGITIGIIALVRFCTKWNLKRKQAKAGK